MVPFPQAIRIFASRFLLFSGHVCDYDVQLCGFPRLPALGQCPQVVADSSS